MTTFLAVCAAYAIGAVTLLAALVYVIRDGRR